MVCNCTRLPFRKSPHLSALANSKYVGDLIRSAWASLCEASPVLRASAWVPPHVSLPQTRPDPLSGGVDRCLSCNMALVTPGRVSGCFRPNTAGTGSNTPMTLTAGAAGQDGRVLNIHVYRSTSFFSEIEVLAPD